MRFIKTKGRLMMSLTNFLFLLSVVCFGTLAQADMAYIANYDSGNVSVIDTSINKVVATIAVGGNPTNVAVNPTGTRAYVNCGSKSADICVIDTNTNTIIKTVVMAAIGNAGTNNLFVNRGMAFNLTGTILYVTCNVVSICMMDTKTNEFVGTPASAGQAPNTIVVNPSNTLIYVANTQSHDVSVINTTNSSTVATVKVGTHPFEMAITPDGSRVYVANQASAAVSVIDTKSNSVTKTIPVGGGPTGVVINPTGTRVYVTNHTNFFGGIPNTVSVIDTSNDSVIATIPVGSSPVGISINVTGTRVYVANKDSNNISVIDTSTNKVIDTVPVGSKPYSQGKFIGTTNICPADTNGSIQMGIDQCKANPVSCGIVVSTDQCKTNPASCGLFTQAQIDATKQACKTDPTSCGIIVSTDQCKTNPASCNLFTQVQVDAAKQAGIDLCKTNPSNCSLFTQAQIDAAKQTGITQCKTTPASCGITLIDNNGSTQAGIDQCKTNPASCGITKIDGISTNAFVSPANKMIAGVLISGGTKRVMVRASSVDGAVDPLLEIVTYPDRKPLGNNDSWATDPAAAELTQKKLAPARATDAAMIISLPPGLFTMEVSSKNGGSGANVIEVYDMAVFP